MLAPNNLFTKIRNSFSWSMCKGSSFIMIKHRSITSYIRTVIVIKEKTNYDSFVKSIKPLIKTQMINTYWTQIVYDATEPFLNT